jgi:hypothetical protein
VNGDTEKQILQRLTEIRDDNRVDHEMFRENLVDHGERIVAVETNVIGLIPKVETACKKANSVKVSVAELKGEKKGEEKGRGKVMRYLWPVLLTLFGGGVTLLISFIAGG